MQHCIKHYVTVMYALVHSVLYLVIALHHLSIITSVELRFSQKL